MSQDDLFQDSQRVESIQDRFAWPVLIAALVTVPVIAVQSSNLGSPWQDLASVANWACWLVFLAEAVVMIRVSGWAWVWNNPLTVAVVLLSPPFLPDSLAAARLLRLLRILRIFPAIGLAKRLLSLEGIRFAGLIAVTTIIAGGMAFAEVEPEQNLGPWDGVWWAVTTVTTVGYGDIYPETDIGRAIAMSVMFVGIGFVALITAFIADRFIRQEIENEVANREDRILAKLDEIDSRLRSLEDLATKTKV